MTGHYHFNGAEYCEDCLPVSPDDSEVGLDTGEQDSPAHCDSCHCHLDYSLTSDGVRYVLNSLLDHIRNPDAGNGDVLDDWAENLRWYGLGTKERNLLDCFLDRRAKRRKEVNS